MGGGGVVTPSHHVTVISLVLLTIETEICMKKTYEPPTAEVWMIDLRKCENLLVSMSLEGNISDFEPGNEDDLIEDDWGI